MKLILIFYMLYLFVEWRVGTYYVNLHTEYLEDERISIINDFEYQIKNEIEVIKKNMQKELDLKIPTETNYIINQIMDHTYYKYYVSRHEDYRYITVTFSGLSKDSNSIKLCDRIIESKINNYIECQDKYDSTDVIIDKQNILSIPDNLLNTNSDYK